MEAIPSGTIVVTPTLLSIQKTQAPRNSKQLSPDSGKYKKTFKSFLNLAPLPPLYFSVPLTIIGGIHAKGAAGLPQLSPQELLRLRAMRSLLVQSVVYILLQTNPCDDSGLHKISKQRPRTSVNTRDVIYVVGIL